MTTPQSAAPTAPLTRVAKHLIRPCGAPSPQGEGLAGGHKGVALQGERQWDDYPSVGCADSSLDKGSLCSISGRSIKPVLIFCENWPESIQMLWV